MNYMGDYAVGQIVYIYFNTFDSNDPSASVTITNFANTDVHIHKDDSLTQRNNAAGITVRTAGGANTVFADLLSTAAGDGKNNTVKLIGSTGDHFIVVAQSSSQWNILSYSSNAATSSGA